MNKNKAIIYLFCVTIITLIFSGCMGLVKGKEPVLSPQEAMTDIDSNMVTVQGGEFQMGSLIGDIDEKPVRKVKVKSFMIGKYEVTQSQYTAIMKNNPSNKQKNTLPVYNLTWYDCQEFIKKLNQLAGKNAYRLPTEAEWEYACRAGTTTEFFFGEDKEKLNNYGYFNGNSDNIIRDVGKLKPNPWGLYDMYGNAWEWCNDWYGNYRKTDTNNPKGPQTGDTKVMRGGCWDSSAPFCRSANRANENPKREDNFMGIRLVKNVE